MKPVKNVSLKNLDGEVWVDCMDYEGVYEISNKGRVKSVLRIILTSNGKERIVKPRILKQELKNRSGGHKSYARVCLCTDGKQKNIAVHKLMANSGITLQK